MSVFFDTGAEPGAYRDLIAHSPCLKASEYVGGESANRSRAAVSASSLHAALNTNKGQDNHAA